MSVVPTWPVIERRAKERIEELRTALEAATTERIPGLQAEIRAWREVLALPTTLSPETNLEPDRSGY